jgi:hypothetical protein
VIGASSIDVDEALIVLKIAFVVLLYLFIWRIVRAASRELRSAPVAESVILQPTDATSLGLAPVSHARLVVTKSPALEVGDEIEVDSLPVGIGRGGQNDVPLEGDEFASAEHARFEARRDGLWVEDVGSTNGTFVNGARVTTARRLTRGDLVRVGQTELKVVL